MRHLSVTPGANDSPSLSVFALEGEGPTAVAMIDYSDANANCPVTAEIAFDGGAPYGMYPASLDYSTPVTYSTEPGIGPLAGGTWTSALLCFSDNVADTVTYLAPGVGVPRDNPPWGEEVLRVQAARNPVREAASIEFDMPARGVLTATVYDVRGSLIACLIEAEVDAGPGALIWSLRDEEGDRVPAGVYFCRVSALGDERTVKIVLLR